jgi:short subunit dehydrogenase-like uncharacterized protein
VLIESNRILRADVGRTAILGATGYTGRLVVEYAREAGLPLRLVGRRREALATLAGESDELAVADAGDTEALRRAFEGCEAVVSLAGPFLDVGVAPVAAAIDAGARYLDSSGEQAWALLLRERFAAAAEAAGVAVLPCFGFDYVPGDLAARLAADGLEPLREIVVAYSVSGAATSRGTRRTISRVMRQPQVAYVDGRLVPSRFGATTRTIEFPFGERDVVEWTGTEPLTVPRHTDVRTVRSYVRGPRIARFAGRISLPAAALVRLASLVGPVGPDQARRGRTRFAVVAEARGEHGNRRVTLTGTDPYALTALLLVRGASLPARAAGVVAPAETFDAAALGASLAPLLRVGSAARF